MYQQFIDTPRRLAAFRRPTWILLRVIAGTLLLAGEDQELRDGRSGLPITSADGLVHIKWEPDQLWARAENGTCEVQVVIPK